MTEIDFWEERKSGNNSPRKDDYREPFEKDYSRIIHSAAFRRLQRKTQVLGLGDGDFYRTRLTHTIEVSQIANGICNFLRRKFNDSEYADYIPNSPLISSISAAHDIGHPPFGHGGEVALNYMMRNYDGFEGNAHTLNLLTNFEEREPDCGMDLTRRMLLGIVKYPTTYRQVLRENQSHFIDNHLNTSFRTVKSKDWKPPKCIFDKDKNILDWILKEMNEDEAKEFTSFTKSNDKNTHSKPKHKSFDCSIMELADDISYGIHDLEDAIHLKLIDRDNFESYLHKHNINLEEEWACSYKIDKISDHLFSKNRSLRKNMVGSIINYFISSITIKKKGMFKDNIVDLNANINEKALSLLKCMKDFAASEIIKTPEIQTLEYRGQVMVMEIFEAIHSDPQRFLSGKTLERLEAAEDNSIKMRAICDHVAGMTDDYATKVYERFFVPGKSSVFQRL